MKLPRPFLRSKREQQELPIADVGGDGVNALALVVYGEASKPSLSIAAEILMERRGQIEREGFAASHDDAYRNGELARAAAAYAFSAGLTGEARKWLVWDHKPPRPPEQVRLVQMLRLIWPWDARWWKPRDPRRDLVRAGALIIAAIERIDREAARDAAQRPLETGI